MQARSDLTTDIYEEIDRLKFTLDHVGAYVFTKDTEGRYTYANDMVCKLYGLPLGDIVGRRAYWHFNGHNEEALPWPCWSLILTCLRALTIPMAMHLVTHYIKAIVDACRKTLRDADLMGRLGGDEFVIVVSDTDEAGRGCWRRALSPTNN